MSAHDCPDWKYMECIKCSECRFWNDLSATLADLGFCHNGEVADNNERRMMAWQGCVYGIRKEPDGNS